jgi:hypothetical protein
MKNNTRKRHKQPKLRAGQRVVSSYRVAPFLADEVLTLVTSCHAIAGSRVLVQSDRRVNGKPVIGWLDADTLTAAAE